MGSAGELKAEQRQFREANRLVCECENKRKGSSSTSSVDQRTTVGGVSELARFQTAAAQEQVSIQDRLQLHNRKQTKANLDKRIGKRGGKALRTHAKRSTVQLDCGEERAAVAAARLKAIATYPCHKKWDAIIWAKQVKHFRAWGSRGYARNARYQGMEEHERKRAECGKEEAETALEA